MIETKNIGERTRTRAWGDDPYEDAQSYLIGLQSLTCVLTDAVLEDEEGMRFSRRVVDGLFTLQRLTLCGLELSVEALGDELRLLRGVVDKAKEITGGAP